MVTIAKDVLDDLCSRFLVNLPPEEIADPVRLCFQAELAHWFYLDYYCGVTENCPKCGVRDFIRQMFNHCSLLKQYACDVDSIVDRWRDFKAAVPTYGAILLDESMENVLLVQGYYAKSSWGFPKGKINEEEKPHECAVREVLEETGYDASGLISEDDFMERQFAEKTHRLYMAAGADRDFDFKPKTRNEIKECRWFPITSLPTSKADNTKNSIGIYPNHFAMVFPFVEQIKKWVNRRRNGVSKRSGVKAKNAAQKASRQRSVSHSSPLACSEEKSKSCRPKQTEKRDEAISVVAHQSENRIEQMLAVAVANYTANKPAAAAAAGKNTSLKNVRIQPVNSWQNFGFDWSLVLRQL